MNKDRVIFILALALAFSAGAFIQNRYDMFELGRYDTLLDQKQQLLDERLLLERQKACR